MWLGVGMPNMAGQTRLDSACCGGNGMYICPFLVLENAFERSHEQPCVHVGEG